MEKWKKKITDSAEHIDIPDSLKPEHIRLSRKTHKSVYRGRIAWAGAAAAVLLLFAGLGSFLVSEEKKFMQAETAMDQAAVTTESFDAGGGESVEESVEESAVEDENSEEDRLLGEYYHTGTYQEIQEQMEKIWKEQAERRESAIWEEQREETFSSVKDYSVTNLQVEGVDEGDVVKTDGTYLYILGSDGEVTIVKAETLEWISSISAKQVGGEISCSEMYVDGDKLILVGGRYEAKLEMEAENMYCMKTDSDTVLVTYDISDPAKPGKIGTVWQDGIYQTSRKIGSYVYLFSEYDYNPDEEQIVPMLNGKQIAESAIYIPDTMESCHYLVMSAVDLNHPDQIYEGKSVMGCGNQFYITEESIYMIQTDQAQEQTYTNISKFRFADGHIRGEAAASLKGELTDTFAINESDGFLRVLLTDRSSTGTWENPVNRIYVLDEQMEIHGMLDQVAPGETIYSARFVGDRGYFVTYRNTDPLFSVDFSDPDHPEITGELKVTGFSEYLHFYGKDKLLGLGWESDPKDGRITGLKLSMYDVSDPSDVKEENKTVLEGIEGCDGLYDYKMILADGKENLIGFSVYDYDAEGDQEQYLVFSYDPETGFRKELEHTVGEGKTSYRSCGNTRGLYIGDRLYIAEEGKISTFDRKNGFEEEGSLELPKKR